jgi:hypothetical protein
MSQLQHYTVIINYKEIHPDYRNNVWLNKSTIDF